MQYVHINNTHSQLKTITLDVPQESILGSILFNLPLLFFEAPASLYNFADDNTLSTIAATVSRLI